MVNFLKSHKKRTLFAFLISFLDVLFFYSMRPLWSGTGKVVGSQAVPPILFVLMCLGFIAVLVLMLLKKEGWYMWCLLGLSIFWVIAFVLIIALGGSAYLGFVMRNFGYALLIGLLIFVFVYMIFFYPQSKFKDIKWLKITVFSLASVLTVYCALGIRFNTFTYSPVVYAVEDNYQIVFSTRNNSKVSVKVGDDYYYDTYAGSSDTETHIHKVTVPMKKLDSVKAYTINAQSMFYRGPFGAFEGRTISMTKTFRPIDETDGIQYYSLSDVHGAVNAATKAGSYFGDKLDFLVLDGDIVSYCNNDTDCNLANKLAYNITNGERPVVYARGNHETKEEYANQLYKYVGAKGTDFYYYFKLGSVFGLVMDIGEDHDDDWWEYYGTSHFTDYQNAQLDYIDNLSPLTYLGSKYRMVVCHVPLVHINYRKNFYDFKIKATEKLNNLSLDMNIMGHQHEMMPLIPGTIKPLTKVTFNSNYKGDDISGQVTDFNFLSMMVGKRSNSQERLPDDFLTFEMSGMATTVDYSKHTETCSWTNAKKEKVMVAEPYVEGALAKEDFVYPLKNA